MTVTEAAGLAVAAAAAGIINSVAGGGTIVSFPVAVALGLPPITANATNAVALTPGSIASAFAYRRELHQDRDVLRLFLPPAAVGAVLGALLLLLTPQKVFDAIIPVLVFFTSLLLLVQNLRRPAHPPAATAEWRVPQRPIFAVLLQLAIGVYGGYFGGGMGIMMLALLGRMGGTDIHRMNGVKSVLGAAINGVAAIAFLVAGTVDGVAAVIMSAGAILGGFAGAAVARKVRPLVVRWLVVVIGFALTVALAYRRWG